MEIVNVYEKNLINLHERLNQEKSNIPEIQPKKKRRKLSSNQENETPGTKIKIFERSFEASNEYDRESSLPKNINIVNDNHIKLKCYVDGKLIVNYCQTTNIPLMELTVSGVDELRSELILLSKIGSKTGLSGDVSFKLKNVEGIITANISYQVFYSPSLENVIKRDVQQALIKAIYSQNAADDPFKDVQISPQIFYQSICDHTKQLPPFNDEFDIPELEVKLLNFQKRTVNWMLEKESAKYDFETSRCKQLPYFTENDLNDEQQVLDLINKTWYGWKLINLSNEQVFFNGYTGHLATFDQIKQHMINYLQEADKSSYPTVLPAKALLSEEMGLGKTVETTSIILLNQRPIEENDRKIEIPINEYGDLKTIITGRTTLIISPVTILPQWMSEMKSLAPSLSVTEYRGVNNYPMFDNKAAIIADYLRKFDVVFTTYNIIAKELDYAKFSSKLRKTRAGTKNKLFDDNEEELDGDSSNTRGSEESAVKWDYSEGDYEFLFQLAETRKPKQANAKTNEEQTETDFEQILQDEIRKAMDHNKIPKSYKSTSYESPLMLIQFWRVVLDEVQMVSSTVSRAFQSAALIPRYHSWGVSGTPIKKDLWDLASYLKFLKVFPFNSPGGDLSFKLLLQNPSDFVKFWSNMSIRHTKAMVHDDIKLPTQNRVLLTTPFTAVEQEMYDEQFGQCLTAIGLDSKGNPLNDDYELTPSIMVLMRSWLSRLRQLCCSPQVGTMTIDVRRAKRANFRGRAAFADTLKTLDHLLDEMLSKSYGDLSDVERKNMDVVSKVTDFLEFIYYPDLAKVYLEVGITEIRKIVFRLEIILNHAIEEYKKTSKVNYEDDDEIGIAISNKKEDQDGNYKEEMIFKFRTKLRLWLLLLHRFYFFYASANFQLHDPEFQELVTKYKRVIEIDYCLGSQIKDYNGVPNANHLAALVSSAPDSMFEREEPPIDLGSFQENESKYYELAETIRARILQPVVKQLNKTINSKIDSREFYFSEDSVAQDLGDELYPKTSKKFFNQIPIMNIEELSNLVSTPRVQSFVSKAEKTITKLNEKAEVINEEFKKLISILREPVTDLSRQPDENDYQNNLESQLEIEKLLASLDGKLYERKYSINRPVQSVYYHNPSEEGEDFSSLVSELTSIEEEINNGNNNTEIELITSLGQKIRKLFENQKFAYSSILREQVNCNAVFNARVEYFRQLQQISDSVEATKYPHMDRENLDVYDVENRLSYYRRAYEQNNASIDKHVGRFRYLSELVKESKLTDEDGDENGHNDVLMCIICRSGITLGSLTKCGHKYCKDCLSHWLRNSRCCPVCKTRIEQKSIYNFTRYAPELKAKEMTDDEPDQRNGKVNSIYKALDPTIVQEIEEINLTNSVSTKVDMIVKQALYLKKNNPKVQIVIFSQWQDMLYILSLALKSAGVSYIGSKGVLPDENQQITLKKNPESGSVEMFKDPSFAITCFLLNAKAQASGLNLVNATHIFLCEPLVNTSIELQAISRIHRIGQTKPTTVWMFAIENTVEESIVVTSTNKRLKLMEKSYDDDAELVEEEAEVERERELETDTLKENEMKLSLAESAILSGGLNEKMLEKKQYNGETVSNNDLWHSFFSSKLQNKQLGL
ncbi:uncharacterized protein KGF55_001516 [Candida pseudojiufengensis]|uniref:uncharacterized protein n=1 Tax=Candida pseudojiufengensis TaxID=497109 RepID=UPI0022245643|nr:uncharacterized protein KGF55_001516 [Candida pseudojiufengensis]KAI5965296.1 hypothetical protein KGF55_001516 [Candida pseudojiufengensis]